MSLPLIAVVGRPNVGKSSLVNRLSVSKEAIVHPTAGVTRDRHYIETDWNGRAFTIVDTGGMFFRHRRSVRAADHASGDGRFGGGRRRCLRCGRRTGIMAEDEQIAKVLRGSEKPVLLAVNKIDSGAEEMDIYQFYALGLGDPFPVSAMHGLGTGDLLDDLVALIPGQPRRRRMTR